MAVVFLCRDTFIRPPCPPAQEWQINEVRKQRERRQQDERPSSLRCHVLISMRRDIEPFTFYDVPNEKYIINKYKHIKSSTGVVVLNLWFPNWGARPPCGRPHCYRGQLSSQFPLLCYVQEVALILPTILKSPSKCKQ